MQLTRTNGDGTIVEDLPLGAPVFGLDSWVNGHRSRGGAPRKRRQPKNEQSLSNDKICSTPCHVEVICGELAAESGVCLMSLPAENQHLAKQAVGFSNASCSGEAFCRAVPAHTKQAHRDAKYDRVACKRAGLAGFVFRQSTSTTLFDIPRTVERLVTTVSSNTTKPTPLRPMSIHCLGDAGRRGPVDFPRSAGVATVLVHATLACPRARPWVQSRSHANAPARASTHHAYEELRGTGRRTRGRCTPAELRAAVLKWALRLPGDKHELNTEHRHCTSRVRTRVQAHVDRVPLL